MKFNELTALNWESGFPAVSEETTKILQNYKTEPP